jgi:putative transposase
MTFYRRNLPHWHPQGKPIFLTWRLYGSLPKDFLGRLGIKQGTGRSACATQSTAKKFLSLDAELDRGAYGPRWLQQPEVAQCVQDAIFHGARRDHYTLYAYVIMPNHVHILIEPKLPLARITGSLKGVSARSANLALGRVGRHFWQDESFDHWVRSKAEFERISSYIEHNPVTAGLAERSEDWGWSSAARREGRVAQRPH